MAYETIPIYSNWVRFHPLYTANDHECPLVNAHANLYGGVKGTLPISFSRTIILVDFWGDFGGSPSLEDRAP